MADLNWDVFATPVFFYHFKLPPPAARYPFEYPFRLSTIIPQAHRPLPSASLFVNMKSK
jgi:hypothetical protein